MATKSSWLVGSANIAAQSLTINGTGYPWAAGYYYLRHTTSALSMIAKLQGMLTTEGIAGASVTLTKGRKVKITFNPGEEFTFSWGGSALRILFGFSGDIGAASPQTAEYISPLLWSPGQEERPSEAGLGVPGRIVSDTRLSVSPSGVMVADGHYEHVVNSFDWSYVKLDRFQTASELGGEFARFHRQVLRRAQKFFLYRTMVEEEDSVDNVTWTSSPLGPYSLQVGNQAKGMSWAFKRSRGFDGADRRVETSLDAIIVPEWGAI